MTVLHHAFSALMASVPHRKSLSLGPEGKPTGTDESWCSQKNARSFGTEVGQEGAASQHCVARALQKCPGRACMAFLLRPQEVRRVDNTCTQCDPKTLDSLVHYILQCRRKGKSCDVILRQQNQGRACRVYLLQQAASPCTAHSNMRLNSGPCASTCLRLRRNRDAQRSATTFVRW